MKSECKTAAKPLKASYRSVEDLLKGIGASPETIEQYEEAKAETRVTLQLAQLRQMAGITQEEMAAYLKVSQAAISKLEAGPDDDLTLKEIRAYAKVVKQRISLNFGKPLTHREAIRVHAAALKTQLEALAEIAQSKEGLRAEIQDFFGEAFFKLFNIMASSAATPSGEAEVEISVQVDSAMAPGRNSEKHGSKQQDLTNTQPAFV